MIKDITLGQFFPGQSAVHRLDPRAKLLVLVLYIATVFIVEGLVSYTMCIFLLIFAIMLSKISPKLILRSLRPIIMVIAITSALNMLYTPGEVIFTVWVLKITREGIIQSIFITARIALLVASASLLTYTTSPIALTDAIETLLGPLKKVKIPVHEFAMMMTIALRFIPNLIEETDKIMSAQKSRGADFESGNLLRRVKAMIPVLVPLFVSAIRRAEELAVAMDCRLYTGGEGRTRLHVLRYGKIDAVAGVIALIACAGVIACARLLP